VAAGKLYVVATPIGNLDDLSPRAVETLRTVDAIAAEDTRVTRRLLARAGIRARLLSYREENERRLAPELVERLRAGDDVALVSDAGTPCISDPGYRLVTAAAAAGVDVVAVPGPSAIVALLSISGLPTDRFSFEGFLPPGRAARRRELAGLASRRGTYVFYESPRRVVRLLGEIAELLGDPPVAVGRELTKVHEEVLRGSASEVAQRLAEQGARGELTVAVHVAAARHVDEASPAQSGGVAGRLTGEALAKELADLLGRGMSVRDAAALLKKRGASRRDVYDAARALRGE
jgi:16S rRNA (cytidine1402-2'-O)-methyltransferase